MPGRNRSHRAAVARATSTKPAARPAQGWLRGIREGLGWPRRVVAEKLNISPAAVRDFEEGELTETISLRTLRRTADALDCDVVITLVARAGRATTTRRDAPAAVPRPPKQPRSPRTSAPLADTSGELASYLK